MNKEEQYLLFALSTPMEILNQGCKPAHDSPKMYTGIKEFDLSSSWGINNRDDLIQTIYQMTDDGHANDLAGLYLTWHRSSPEEWKALIAGGSERGLIYTQFVAQTAMCCGEGGIKAWDYVRMGFFITGWCAQQVVDGRREFMAAIARLYTSTPLLSQLDALFFCLFVRASLLAIFSVRRQRFATRGANPVQIR
ncbi:putative tRNA ligase [Escherichia coli]|nr:putative tRNA ligase [Escherichia coli]